LAVDVYMYIQMCVCFISVALFIKMTTAFIFKCKHWNYYW